MMKNILLVLTFFVLFAAFLPFKKKKEFLPPGTVKISDTLYADETEVSNFSWLQYQNWVGYKYGYNSSEYNAVLPDTMVWREKLTYNEPYAAYYLRHVAYRDYPVVGISYEQVVEFCKWRTERVMESIALKKDFPATDFKYRLPTKKEWEFLSNNGAGCFSKEGRNEKGLMTSNHVWVPGDSLSAKTTVYDNADVTAPVYSYWPNSFKLWNMIGNVSEMVSEKGISKGGSWRNRLEECRVGKDISYEKPMAWLGFRCVCVVKKKPA